MKYLLLVTLALVLVGCKGSDEPPAAMAGTGSGSGSAPKPAIAADAAVAAPDAAGNATAGSATTGTGSDGRCAESCLFLTETPIEKLPEVFEKTCGKPLDTKLVTDNCKQLDYERNCIFAAHGFVNKKKKWQKLFAAKPWYQAHPEWKPSALTSLEVGNVHALNQQGKACKKGVAISLADRELVVAWFKALAKGKAEIPLAFGNDSPFDAESFRQSVAPDIGLANSLLTYREPIEEITKAMPGKKLRGIVIDYVIPKCEDDCETNSIGLVYDESSKLVAVEYWTP